MIKYDEKNIYLIGGSQNDSVSKKTWIVNPANNFQIRDGPSLQFSRKFHGCAKMQYNGKTILVVAGGWNRRTLDSVELLDPLENQEWITG